VCTGFFVSVLSAYFYFVVIRDRLSWSLTSFSVHAILSILYRIIICYMLHHSLTHCCAWPAEGRSDRHNKRSMVANCQALMGSPISSSTCWSQVLRGRHGGCFQSGAKGVPSIYPSMDRCSAWEAGVSVYIGSWCISIIGRYVQLLSGVDRPWGKVRDHRSVSLVVSFIVAFDILIGLTPRAPNFQNFQLA